MLPVFTFDEIRIIEKNIIEKESIPSIILMENAGKNSFDLITKEVKNLDEKDIFIICGKGNNAGDGFTFARHCLVNNISVTIVLVVEPSNLKGDALINYEILKKISYNKHNNGGELSEINFDDFVKRSRNYTKKNTLIIDAIIGTGIKGQLDDIFSNAIKSLNNLKLSKNLKIISLDVPSGVMSGEQVNPVIHADITVSMGTYKAELLLGEGKENTGELYVVPIGITDGLLTKYNSQGVYLIQLSDVKKLFPKRRKTSYKYANGKVLIIGGSRGLSGAVAMSCLSAFKSGAGGVVAAIPKSISTIFNRKLYEVMTVDLDETDEGTIKEDQYSNIKKRMDWADTVLLGPGISLNEKTKEFVFDVIKNCTKNLVIDADALNLLSSDVSVLKNIKHTNEIILTPHPGEFSRLTGIDTKQILLNRFEVLRNFVKEHNVNVALKSETTVSCTRSGEVYINSSGNETLAMAGSGDVLSGIMVSLFSQTNDPKAALISGNYLHGLCADLYAEKTGNKQTASPQDMIKLIPTAVSHIFA
jgi:NAD(P)H-hydrate epimerase